MQEGMYEALAALGQRMCSEGFNAVILQGCEITSDSGTVSVAPGWVYVKYDNAGYVCRVESHSIQSNTQPTLTGNTIRWHVSSINYDAAGKKTFYNNTMQQTYQIIKANIVEDCDDSNPTYLESVKPVWLTGATGKVKSSLEDGMLRIVGEADSVGTAIFDTLDARHCPSQFMYVPIAVIGQDTGGYYASTLQIMVNGSLSVIYYGVTIPQEYHTISININIPIQ